MEQFPDFNVSKDITILSIGAGDVEINVDMSDNPNADWGIQQWGPKLVDLMMQAPPMQVDLVLKTLMKEHYHRFDVALNPVGGFRNSHQIGHDLQMLSLS